MNNYVRFNYTYMPGRQQIPSFQLPSGTTAERDGSYNLTNVGNIFYNTDTSNVEIYHQDPSNNAAWRDLVVNNKGQIDLSGNITLNSRSLWQVGEISFFAGSTVPNGWLECNGAHVSRTAYSDLYAVIGFLYGVSTDITKFVLPDLRDKFIRGKTNPYGGGLGMTIDQQWKSLRIISEYAGSTYTHNANYAANTNLNNSSGGANVFTGRWQIPGTRLKLQWGTQDMYPKHIIFNICIKY